MATRPEPSRLRRVLLALLYVITLATVSGASEAFVTWLINH
jgi:hypothetical protein